MSIGAKEIESWLRDRAAEALRIPAEAIDPARPLIDQGLDSLGAIELGQAVETALGVELPPGVLLEGASLKDLTPLERGKLIGLGGGAPLLAGGYRPAEGRGGEGSGVRSGGGRLSPTQRGLWFLHRLHPTSTAYHLSTLTRVLGEATNADLRATFQAMVDRHPALRTTFPLVGDEPVQVIPEQGELAFAEIDAAGWSDAELRSRLEKEAFRPFDLERGPVFRAALFDRGTERFLVAGMHHIVSDFGALVNLLQEAPRPETKKEPTKSFAQFVDWQAEMLAGPEGARLEAFWRERLAGLPELDLPADRVKPMNAPEQGGAAWREIGAETLVRLKALARSRGATLYVVLLAAFQTYLHRITGQEDFAIGSPVAGRPAGFGRVFGYFTNPVVLRAEMEGDPPFRELVDRARRRVVEALDNQHFPLPLLVERLGARSELFRVLFVLHRAPAEASGLVAFSLGEGGARLRLDGFELESLPLAPQGSQFDATLAAGERHGSLGLQVIYDAARFDATTIARWLQHLDNLLTAAAGQPETPLSELPLLSPWERQQILREANDGSDAGLGDLLGSTLHEGFERQAARTPAAVALIDGTRRLTYEELDARSSALAEELRRRGAGPESVVAVKLPRTAELIVALLGVLKAGAAYLPLDPAYPEERIAFMVEDAGAGIILDFGFSILDSPHPIGIHDRSGEAPIPNPKSQIQNLAYLIYTSGSTGRPKGVAIEHAAAVRLVSWAGQAFSGDELRGVLAATSVNFDLSIFEIFVPLSFGGTVILAENALALPALPARDEVTLINTVPSAIAGLLEMGPLPASVRTVNLAGEPLRRALADQVLAAGVRLWDLYGPSEDTTYSTGAIVAAGDPSEPVIGWPLAGSRAFVLGRLEQGFRPLPLGVPGELCLGGGGLARGYLGRAALTAEKFIPSPFGEEPGARLYRTGDLVRRRFDGALEYLGRIDHQVKIRGFRIELGEVEAALLAVPGVREAVVVAREGTLIAYVALVPDQLPPLPEGGEVLREALRERLPAPFVPSVFVLLDALPRTPNGKVDRKALPVPEIAVESSLEAPVGPVEEAVAAVWAGVLGRDRIGRSERFFDLGGHSLLAARVMARLREALGVDLPLTALFDAPTVAGLAAQVAAAQAASGPPLAPVPRDRPLPLSFAQQRLWFLDRLEPGMATYNVPLAVRLEGLLSRDLLARALREVARRHEAVRTTYEAHGGDPVQIVHPPAPVPVPLVDLQALPEAARAREARRLAREEELRPFDLERGPVLRAGLLRLTLEEHVLLLTLHHIACDDQSIRLLFREVVTLYAAWSDGGPAVPARLPALPVQYADFAVWQRERLTGPVLASQLAFWRSRLADPPTLELPADRPRPAHQTFRGARLAFALPVETSAVLLAIGRDRGATAFMTLLAAFQALLARTAGQTDLTVGTPISGRTRVEVESLIGFFLNTLVLRADLSGNPGFAEIVDRTRARVLEAFAHQDLPFEKLVDEMGVQRNLGHSPLFQALFVLLHTAPLSGEPTSLRVEPFVTGGATAKFDCTLAIAAEGEALTGVIEYNTDLFDRTTALRLAERFRVLCAGAAREPHRPLAELPVLSEPEAHQILREHNDRPPRHDVEIRLPDLVAAWAGREPERIAVEWPGASWSYAEFVGRARELAARLRALGVGPDIPVAVSAGRGPELPLAFLAVLEAGGAYLPIDPAWPRERQDFMVADAGAKIILDFGFSILDSTRGQAPIQNPKSKIQNQIAYLIYTSGSTGRPKGVAVPHRVLSNLILWQIDPERRGAMPGPWRTLQFSSPSFDVSLQEMLSTWCAGGTLVLCSDEDRRDPVRLARLLAEREIDRIFLPFVALQQLAEALARPETPVPARLRRVITAGEQLQVTPQVAEAFRRLSGATGGTALHNQYGPSETHVVTELVLDGDPDRWPALPSIGRPVAGTSAFVLDRALKPMPIGVPGELALGGFSPARGYLGRPAQTAEKFIPDAWSGVPGARLYRSGDLARLLPDGSLEFLGRIDHQVKIRGYRIEPGEIEAALTAYPGVADAVVLAPADARGERRLVAFVVPAVPDPGRIASEKIRDFLKRRLPDFMVPSAVALLDALPVTPSGKTDLRALSQASVAPAPSGPAGEAPRTPIEQVVAAIWGDLLGIGSVGRRDSFFELGGHSLLAARVCTRLRDAFGIEVPVRDLFEEPTVAGLSARVEAGLRAGRGEGEDGLSLVPLAPQERAAGVPLSFAQRRLWFFARLAPGSALYHIPVVLRAGGPLDAARLERALAEVERRHEALRTVLAAPAGDPLQVVLPPRPFALPVLDLRALPAAEREACARAVAAEEALRPFDLERGPLWRAVLVRLTPEEHVLLLTLHHIVSDGWSLGVLLREVSALYEGEGARLPALPVQYADWAVWQRRWLHGTRLEQGRAAWRQRLAGAPTLLELPADRPRPAVRAFRGALHVHRLPAELADGLRTLARREGSTLFMVLLAAFQALLARWSGRRDLIVGTPVACRDRLEIENLIGFFVNTLPLRSRLAGDPPFRAMVAAARGEVLAAHAHREIPFEQLVEDLAPDRGLGHAPLVQVVLSLDNTPRVSLAFGGLTLEPVALAGERNAGFDLHLAADETREGLETVWHFDTDLLDPGSVASWVHRLDVLLAGVVRDPDRSLADLPLLDEAETALLLTGWSGAAHASLPEATIPELFAAGAARHPDATAVVSLVGVSLVGGELTWGELAARAGRLALRLRTLGVGPETPVALLLERSADLIVAMLAVLEAGGVYVPLDPAWPEERRSLIVQDAGVAWTLAEGLVIHPSPGGPRRAAGGGRLLPDHLACILYTSGSTGRPKGAGVTHRGVVRLLRDIRWARLEGETFLVHSPFTFDASTLEIWGPLSNGGRLVLAPPGPLAPADLVRIIESHGVTTAWLTAALFHQVVDEHLEGLRPLRQLLAGGEVLSPPHCERLLAALPALRLINGYGPTENTTFTTTHALLGPQRIAGSVPIGRPIDGTFVRVLDPDGRLAAPGSPGELCAGGAGLARGYLGRPDLTAQRFVPDPFAVDPGARLYRTGDLVRWRRDGDLEFLGRLDLQIKVHGFRIEPGEVEAALAASPSVAEAAVLAVSGGAGGERRLAAFVVPAPSQEPTPTALRDHLRRRLPAYMVPSFFHVLKELPLTPSGKIDRRALERLRPAEEPSGSPQILPRDPVEEMVAALWSDILGIAVDRIGARDDFFELGGHSLLATRIGSRLRQAFSVEVPLRDILEQPTVEALAARVRGALADEAAGPQAPPLVRTPRRSDPPLSFAQLRLWIIDRIEPGTATYNVPLAVRLDGELDPGLLARAFGEVARRHEAVRTTFGARGGDPVQIVHPPAPVPVPVADLAALPDAARAREVQRLARAEEVRPFDLERGPVLRAGLLRLAPAEHVLLLTLHHIACDEWSLRLLFHEVVTLLAAWREGRSAVLPALPVQYSDFAVWQREWLAGPVLESQLAFWRTRLGDPPVLELPTDRPRPPLQTFRGAWISFDLPDETSAALFALSRRGGATAFMTLLAAFQALLARTSGQTDLTVGTPITGRTRVEVENLIGFFLNTLVLRADLSGDPGFAEIVDRTRARVLEAFAHQDLPFEKLVDEMGVQRSLGHSPLFQALFVLLHTAPLSGEPTSLRVEPFVTGGATAKFDCTLAIAAEGTTLSGVIEYNTDLFDRTTALRLAERFRVLCAGAAREPHRPLSDLPVLSEPEAHQILREHNDRPPRHDVDIRLPDLVAAWAEREPERIAVEWPRGSWTYAEFVGRARELAARLRALGVGPDIPVAVSAGRGPELPLAFLAVLEAGGAYLPVDPAWPRERQDFMVADAGAKVILDFGFSILDSPHPLEIRDRSGQAPIQNPKSKIQNQIAYLIYTSGSTGRPKGVAVPHRVLTNLILWQIDPERRGAMPGPWRTLQFSSPSFDVSLQEMLSTWCAGGTLVLCSDEDRRDPERLARLLAKAGIERLFLPYVALQQLADRLARPDTPVPSRLRRVITAGEQLQVTPQVAEAFHRLSAATGGTVLHNQYGPSETHVVTELILEGDPARWPALPSIGRPVAGTSAFVLDRALKPQPIGVPGELALGGFSPARGYLGRPDQTAEKFIPDAWSGEPGARLYRSGDLARLLPNGTIELLGRIDHQVKIRGYRVEPGEIEAVLATHPRVRECAVAVREDRPGDRRLIAWVVTDGADGDVAPAELRDHLRARLPDPMVPTAFVQLDTLPLTPSGKVQRSALPAPEGERLAVAPYVEPGTALEREIAAIFRDELALDRVGRDDNFFDLGGHSLTMVRAASQLTERLGRPVAVLDLFRTPTVASLARQLGGEEEALPARETLEERAETRRQSLSRRRELRRGR